MHTSFFIQQWKAIFASLSALVLTITPTPHAHRQQITYTNTGNASNIGSSPGTSRNWSGYTAANGQYTSVTGTWTVPSATGNGHTSADATWIGIGGISNYDLIQAGTQNIVNGSGGNAPYAFYELLPNTPTTIPVTVKPGDSVTVSLTQQTTNQWLIVFTDTTSGKAAYTTTVTYSSSLSSAEWIEEAPSNGVITLPLDNFGSVSFTGGSSNQGTITQSNGQALTMVNNSGQVLATPSPVGSDGSSFTVTRTNTASNSPIPDFDHDPRKFRRHGFGITGYTPAYRRWRHYSWMTLTPTETPTTIPTLIPNDTDTPTAAETGGQMHQSNP